MGQHFAYLQILWDKLITSLWFVPALMIVGAAVLAGAGIVLDFWLTDWNRNSLPWWVYRSNAEDARNVLSTLLTSMITMTSLVFSITMVVLTLAASQFGPRLIRTFMASLPTQIVLGTFVMTIIYCLILLSTVGWRGGERELPFATLSLSIALTIISVVLLVLFIHMLARSIMSENLIDRVAKELDEALDDLATLPLGFQTQDTPENQLPPEFKQDAASVEALSFGYVQAIEFQTIAILAQKSDSVIALYVKPGDFIGRGDRLLGIYPSLQSSNQMTNDLRAAFTLGIQHTPVQDVEFAIRELVEMAVRALSPGINDPYTAVAVVDRMSASVSSLMERALPQSVYSDSSNTVRLVCSVPSYAALINAAFSQIRQMGADKPLIAIHLLQAITRVCLHVRLLEQANALSDQLEAILDAATARTTSLDLSEIEHHAAETRRAVNHAKLQVSPTHANTQHKMTDG